MTVKKLVDLQLPHRTLSHWFQIVMVAGLTLVCAKANILPPAESAKIPWLLQPAPRETQL